MKGYSADDIVCEDKVRNNRETIVMGRNPLPICQYCYDLKIKVPNSGGRCNKYDESTKKKSRKRNQFRNEVIVHKRKKPRKK